jgi:hypothetical protein
MEIDEGPVGGGPASEADRELLRLARHLAPMDVDQPGVDLDRVNGGGAGCVAARGLLGALRVTLLLAASHALGVMRAWWCVDGDGGDVVRGCG